MTPASRSSRRPQISIIGDSRLAPEDPRRALAFETGRLLVDHGCLVMTGGGAGVMEAAFQGARASACWTFGSCVAILPGSDPSAASAAADVVIPTGLDHARNQIVAQADAVIAIGGGAGTLSEMAFAWVHRRLIVGLRCSGWSGRLAEQRIDERIRYPEIPEDRVYGADTAREAVDLVLSRLESYQRRHRKISAPDAT